MQVVPLPLHEASELLRSPKQLRPTGHRQLIEAKLHTVPAPQILTLAVTLATRHVAFDSQISVAPGPTALQTVPVPLQLQVDWFPEHAACPHVKALHKPATQIAWAPCLATQLPPTLQVAEAFTPLALQELPPVHVTAAVATPVAS